MLLQYLRIFEKLQASGVIIYWCFQFPIHDLELLKESSDIVPAVNQVEMHPLSKSGAYYLLPKSGITLQAYTPLARGAYLNSPLMIEIGNRHKKTPTNWSSLAYTTKYSGHSKIRTKKYLEENSKIFDFSLTPEEMAAISAMGQRIN